MKRSVRLKWSNLQVGILVMVVSAILIWTSFTGGGTSVFETKKKFVCYFKNVNGLVNGSPVWMAGIEVGNVRSLEFVNIDSLKQVEVVCAVKSSVWGRITTEAEVLLGSIGFLGDKYIELIVKPSQGRPIEEMEVVATMDAGDVKAVFKEAETAAGKASSLMNNLDSILTRVNRGEGTLGKVATDDAMYVQLTKVLSNLSVLTSDLQKNQAVVVSSIENLSKSVNDLASQVNSNSGTIGKMVNDPQLYDNLTASTSKLDSILAHVNSANGSLGLLVNDTALYSEMTTLMTRVNNLITDIQNDPRKYFKFSVF